MPFERWRTRRRTTLALRVFRAHHTELNGLLWALAPAIVTATRLKKAAADTDATATTFSITAEELRRRVPSPISKWHDTFVLSQTWLRLSALMALASYLEVYLVASIRAALESDPGVLVGASRAVDGARCLKSRGDAYSYLEAAEDVVDGEWSSRISKFKKLFHDVPAPLDAATTELDWMRRVRNGVGHAFGRDSAAYKARLVAKPAPLQAISTARLQKMLGLVDRVAAAVDEFLLARHIGEYEALVLWHLHQSAWRARHDRAQRLSLLIWEHAGVPGGRPFCNALIRHYESL